MLFNSLHFLWFFPLVSLAYFIIPKKLRWIWLLITSFYFYMSWNPAYALLLTISIVITFFSGILIQRANKIPGDARRIRMRKLWVALSFISNLLILFFFKYFDFTVTSLQALFSLVNIQLLRPALDVLLPVGISFYTFQALSYTMDVYRGEVKAETNVAKYALFVSFFPQLVAGPIERSKNLLTQVHEIHTFDYERAKSGLIQMAWGLFEKIVIADRVSIIANIIYDDYQNFSGLAILLATACFALQILCDFAGYSDIAIGAARLLGFRLMDNFRQPYFATSIRDFWQRWHISLSTWFRDYLYIPLGGGRCSTARRCFNLFVTFLVSGLWHGANWTFVFWGGLHGAYQIVGDLTKPARNHLIAALRIRSDSVFLRGVRVVATFLLVDLAWLFFRAPSISDAFRILGRLGDMRFTNLFPKGILEFYAINGPADLVFILFSVALLFTVHACLEKNRFGVSEWIATKRIWIRWPFYLYLIFSVIYLSIRNSGYGIPEFIYFQF